MLYQMNGFDFYTRRCALFCIKLLLCNTIAEFFRRYTLVVAFQSPVIEWS